MWEKNSKRNCAPKFSKPRSNSPASAPSSEASAFSLKRQNQPFLRDSSDFESPLVWLGRSDSNQHPGRYFLFVIFIFGNFRLTAATTAECSALPELLARASRA